MILAALVLQAAAPQSAVEAERAFAAAAQAKGQWTAFRAYAAKDAVMFVPEPVTAQEWLKGKADPRRSVEWWPGASYVSCDGKLAINTGGSRWPNGAVGYFTTVWQRQPDGRWKWIVDHGDALKSPRVQPAEPKVVPATQCSVPVEKSSLQGLICLDAALCEDGKSEDATLTWQWGTMPDGQRTFEAFLWNGSSYDRVIYDEVASAK